MYQIAPSKLFSERRLSDDLREHTHQIANLVSDIPRDQFLVSTEDEIAAHILSRLTVHAIELCEDSMEMEPVETEIDLNYLSSAEPKHVPGIRVTVSIPFTGDSTLWKLQPSTYKARFPKGIVRPPRDSSDVGYLDIVIDNPASSPPQEFTQEFESTLGLVRDYLASQRKDIDQHNARLEGLIRSEATGRRERLRKLEGIAKSIDIPLKRKSGVPSFDPIKVRRRLVRPLPPPPKSGFKPEPGIADSNYEDILSIVRHEGRTFETTPTTFAVHDETGLRDILLAHLNGHYEGSATGETFRHKGKTDIRIEDGNRAAFVAECKVWRGPKRFTEAIDQLVGYQTWRDCKGAIIIFNKQNARFSQLLDKVPEVIREHPRLCADLDVQELGEWRYILTSEEDEARHIVLHVFLFNLYVA